MRLLGLLLLLEILFGCAHVPRQTVRATDKNARLVRAVLWVGSHDAWQHSPWFRAESDMIEWPHKIVVAIDGSACLMDLREVNEPLPGDYHACPTAWRVAR